MILHPIPPVFDEDSEVLILGSFPSRKSREEGFFYGHPRNRFWRVVSAVFAQSEPRTIDEKTAFLLRNHIALWDVIRSCDIDGSSDASIRNVSVNDLGLILSRSDIREIFVNGKTAYGYYQRFAQPMTGRPAVCLPSTSPANAAWDFDRLTEAWRRIAEAASGRDRA